MINVLFYSNTISYGGDWRKLERLIANLNLGRFRPHVFYDQTKLHPRIEHFRKIQKTITPLPFTSISEFEELIKQHQIDVIYFSRSGYEEFPFTARYAPLQIENNIFGYYDSSVYLDKSISLSHTICKSRKKPSDEVIYNPIMVPKETSKLNTLKAKLGINASDLVIGRVGRPDNFDPIALSAFKKLQKKYDWSHVWFLIMGGCHNAKEFIKTNKINNCIFLEPTNDDLEISKFYRTIDIFCHYRSDGETFGNAIAEAMSYGIPVISHTSKKYNAQIEVIGDGGFVVKSNWGYRRRLKSLVRCTKLRKKVGDKGRLRVIETFEAHRITKQFEECVFKWINQRSQN